MIIELPTNLPVGVRFHPTDEELIYHYLLPKIQGELFDDAIAEIDLCKSEPWELPHKSKIKSKSEDRMWWFMCQLSYQHRSCDRLNRKTKSGFWKPTGQPRAIKDRHGKDCIGMKRTLVFHTGKSPGKRTNWVMQEYNLDPKNMPSQERASYVICRLKKKTNEKVDTPDGDGREPSDYILPNHENSGLTATIQQLHGQTEVNHESGRPHDVISNFLLKELYGGDGLQVENDESEADDFVNGLLVDPNEIYYNERTSSPTMSLRRSYFNGFSDGSDTDVEGMSELYVQTQQSSSPFDSSRNSKRARQMRMVNMLSKPLQTCTMSQDFGQENVVSVSNLLTRPVERSNASSQRPLVEPPCVDVRGGIHQKRIQLQENSTFATTSSNKGKEALEHVVATTDQPQKGTMIGEFRNVGKVAERSNAEKHNLGSDKCESSSSKWNTIFTFVETLAVSTCNSQPRSVYWFNAITGTVLFGIFVRELVVFGSW